MARQNVRFSPQSNILVPFSNANKDERNRNLITRFFAFRHTPMQSGPKAIDLSHDPLQRPIPELKQQFRLNASAGGRARGVMRPATAGMVKYQRSNQLQQMTRRPIGPYNQDVNKSIIGRIAGGVTQANGG